MRPGGSSCPSVGRRHAPSPDRACGPAFQSWPRRQALAQTVRDAFSKWQLASVWSAFERAFVLLEATPSTSVSVNRFEFFNIFGYSRTVDEATGLPAEGGQFVTLPLFLFKVFAEAPSRALRSAVAHAGAPDEALLRANLYEMFMVRSRHWCRRWLTQASCAAPAGAPARTRLASAQAVCADGYATCACPSAGALHVRSRRPAGQSGDVVPHVRSGRRRRS